MIYHELFHSYQSYKLESKGIKENKVDLPWTIYHFGGQIKNFNFFNKFTNTAYLCCNPEERGAHLAQLHAKDGDYWVEIFKEIYKKSYDDILKKIRKEVRKSDEPKIVKVFNEISQDVSESDPYHVDTFEELIRFFYDIIDTNKEYMFRKIAKIKGKI
jgi:hypothetical protein